MDTQAAVLIANAFAGGALGAIGSLATASLPYTVAEVGPADGPRIRNQLARYPFVMRGQFATGEGVALLFPMADICALQTLFEQDGRTRTVLDDADFVTLKDTAEACIGAAYANLMQQVEHAIEPLGPVEALIMDPDRSEELCQFVSAPTNLATIDFRDPEQGARQLLLLFSAQLEALVPEAMIAKRAGAGEADLASPNLSDAEMKDILSGFNAQEGQIVTPAPASAAAPPEKAHGKAPANLDMILDIRLVAVARLGRVEMPIGEILALGPGSIIDVGHLVDEPVELLVNNKLIARGDVVVVDEKFGLRITEIVSTKERIESMR